MISATNATNVNIPPDGLTLCFDCTSWATQLPRWIVVFKALVTTHHMCVHGNESHGQLHSTLDESQGELRV
ncbi:unnamed protein product, partial [Coregonus sp. 'balchen']